MTTDILGKLTKRALEKLDSSLFFKESGAYLAGGSGLTLHLDHRYSYDLDFFTPKKFEEDSIIQLIDQCGQFKLERRHWRTILGIFEGVKFSLFYYKYPLLLHFPLEAILKFYDQKYQNLAANRTHILKSLVYFADAENDEMPEMIKNVDWQDLKMLIVEKVKGLTP